MSFVPTTTIMDVLCKRKTAAQVSLLIKRNLSFAAIDDATPDK